MSTTKSLLPADLILDPKRLTQESLHNAFLHFGSVVLEATGMNRTWTPTEILKVADAIARRFAQRLGPDGRIRITPPELKLALQEVIGEIFPYHIAMLMKNLLERGYASFEVEADPHVTPHSSPRTFESPLPVLS